MKYLALLRGINVGGKGTVPMTALKTAFEKAGFTNVSTFINSGNVLFEAEKKESDHLAQEIDSFLHTTFFPISTVVLSEIELHKIVDNIPQSWHKNDLRKYIAFLKVPHKPEEVLQVAQLKEGIDFMEKGPGVVYMSTKMSGLTKSSFPKLITKEIYQYMTMRNYNTVQKLLALIEK